MGRLWVGAARLEGTASGGRISSGAATNACSTMGTTTSTVLSSRERGRKARDAFDGSGRGSCFSHVCQPIRGYICIRVWQVFYSISAFSFFGLPRLRICLPRPRYVLSTSHIS